MEPVTSQRWHTSGVKRCFLCRGKVRNLVNALRKFYISCQSQEKIREFSLGLLNDVKISVTGNDYLMVGFFSAKEVKANLKFQLATFHSAIYILVSENCSPQSVWKFLHFGGIFKGWEPCGSAFSWFYRHVSALT